MRKITLKAQSNGELLVREMSEKARAVYNETDPLTIALFDDETVSLRGGLGDYDYITKEEAEEILEANFWEDEEE